MKLFEAVARDIFRAEHPRTDWQLHPNYAQSKVQARYEHAAKVLLHRIGKWSGVEFDREMETKQEFAGRTETVTRR